MSLMAAKNIMLCGSVSVVSFMPWISSVGVVTLATWVSADWLR